MAKRFTDTDKWKKALLKSMPAAYKLLWLYICDDCDHAGIWQADFEVAAIRIGEEIIEEEAIEIFSDKILVFDKGHKWFIPSFIDFQYGELSPKNNAHASVIKILKKYGLYEKEPLKSPSQGAQDKELDKDKEEGGTGETDSLHVGIVPDMMQDFLKTSPGYYEDKENDYPALLAIAYAIGKKAGYKHSEVINEKREDVRRRWGEYLQFIVMDKWFSTKPISGLKSQWQGVVQSFEKSGGTITITNGINHKEEKGKSILDLPEFN